MTAEVDEIQFRQVLSRFASGLTVVTGISDNQPMGFTCQSFMSVSLHPPLIAISVAKDALSWKKFSASGRFSVNILDQGQEAVSRLFATRGADKFGTVGWNLGETGLPHLSGCLAWVDCRIHSQFAAGDHDVVLGQVESLSIEDDGRPLLYFRSGYRQLDD